MAAGHHADIQPLIAQAFPRLDDLIRLERIA
jgi:hypothetical protein